MKRLLRKNSLLFLFSIYKLLLDITLGVIINTQYWYYGFESGITPGYYLLSWAVFFVVGLFYIKDFRRFKRIFSQSLLFFLFVLSFVPFSSLVSCGLDIIFVISNCVFWLMMFLVYRLICRRTKGVSPKRKTHRNSNVMFLFVAISILVIVFVSYKYAGFRIISLSSNVYEYRSVANSNSLGALEYLFQWAGIILYITLGSLVYRRKYIVSLVISFVLLLSFGYNGMKTTFLMIGICWALPILFRLFASRIIYAMTTFVIIACVAVLAEFFIFNSVHIASLFSFRTLFLPAKISSWFFEFFTVNTPDYFRSSFLRYFGFTSPYSETGIDYIINNVFFGDTGDRANNGLISDAMTNFGIIGIFILPIFIMLFAKAMDCCSRGSNFASIIVASAFFSLSLINGFLTIVLITNGGVVSCIFMWFRSHAKPIRTIRFRSKKGKRPLAHRKNQLLCCSKDS